MLSCSVCMSRQLRCASSDASAQCSPHCNVPGSTTTPSRPAVSSLHRAESERVLLPNTLSFLRYFSTMHTSRLEHLLVLVMLTVTLAVPAAAGTACQLPDKAVLASVVLQDGKLVHQSRIHPGKVGTHAGAATLGKLPHVAAAQLSCTAPYCGACAAGWSSTA